MSKSVLLVPQLEKCGAAEQRNPQRLRFRPPRIIACVLLLAALLLSGCGAPPQIGTDERTYNTVDALYTAVCGKRPDLVDQCERDLADLKKAGKIPDAAHARLTAIIAETRAGQWTTAAERLSKFMEGQTQAPVHGAE